MRIGEKRADCPAANEGVGDLAGIVQEWLTPADRKFVGPGDADYVGLIVVVDRPFGLLIILVQRRAIEGRVGSSRVDLQACKLEYSIVSPK